MFLYFCLVFLYLYFCIIFLPVQWVVQMWGGACKKPKSLLWCNFGKNGDSDSLAGTNVSYSCFVAPYRSGGLAMQCNEAHFIYIAPSIQGVRLFSFSPCTSLQHKLYTLQLYSTLLVFEAKNFFSEQNGRISIQHGNLSLYCCTTVIFLYTKR